METITVKKLVTHSLIALTLPALIASGSQALAAEKSSAERAIEYRESIMNIFSWNLKAMGSVVKGESAYDQAAFAQHAADLAAAARLNLLAGFPEGSDEGETGAKAEVWMTPDDFKEKYQALQTKSEALVSAAASGNLDAIRPAFGDTANSCKECHKAYKE
ncbi:MAG: cytochrome C [Sedimenticola sp.]|nr:MAG: cytochrome C [Sedimenticola sp.]